VTDSAIDPSQRASISPVGRDACFTGDVERFDRALKVYVLSRRELPTLNTPIWDIKCRIVSAKFHGKTMLGIAASRGHVKIVEALIAMVADPSGKDAADHWRQPFRIVAWIHTGQQPRHPSQVLDFLLQPEGPECKTSF
jgi:hypothetical protein